MDEVSGYRVDCRWSAHARSAKADARRAVITTKSAGRLPALPTDPAV